MDNNKNVFLTNYITCEDWDNENYERYEYTKNYEGFLEWLAEDERQESEEAKKLLDTLTNYKEDVDLKLIIEEIELLLEDKTEHWQDLMDEWENKISGDEEYIMPMMNCLRYFPSFVEFEEWERYKCSGSTCLIYDNECGAWAVGMSGGGMDLSPHLLDTFVKLGKGIPTELADSITVNWNAYVDKNVHSKNCELLADAYEYNSERQLNYAKNLRNNLIKK